MTLPLSYLGLYHLLSKTGPQLNAHPLLHTILYMTYYLTFLKLLIPILTLLNQPAWYDEDALEDHCHYRDTPERMAVEYRRRQMDFDMLRGRFQAAVREPFFPI